VMERQGSILPRVLRQAWDGGTLRTLTRSPLAATGAHIVVIGHVTPGEFRIRLKEAQLVGGTMNRFLPIASRRTKLLPDGGNIPEATLEECGELLADSLDSGKAQAQRRITRTDTADRLWHARYAHLRKARPDGPVASALARAVPQVLRLSLAYALTDGCRVIDEQHLTAALALWSYAEATAEWMFGAEVDTGEVDGLVTYIASGGHAGRTRTDIYVEYYQKHKKSTDITMTLGQLMTDGRIREEIDKSGSGRAVTRYHV
jgi:S-ribosylhomocysteine lyase LuxS involved in autoinducer biosynthesis